MSRKLRFAFLISLLLNVLLFGLLVGVWRTSRPARSIAAAARKCSSCCASCTRRAARSC
jgi:hypothetical protein